MRCDLRHRDVDAVEEGASYKDAADRSGRGEPMDAAGPRDWRRPAQGRWGRRFESTDPATLELLERLVREKSDSHGGKFKERLEQETEGRGCVDGLRHRLPTP